jgi:hypothetical protein
MSAYILFWCCPTGLLSGQPDSAAVLPDWLATVLSNIPVLAVAVATD